MSNRFFLSNDVYNDHYDESKINLMNLLYCKASDEQKTLVIFDNMMQTEGILTKDSVNLKEAIKNIAILVNWTLFSVLIASKDIAPYASQFDSLYKIIRSNARLPD